MVSFKFGLLKLSSKKRWVCHSHANELGRDPSSASASIVSGCRCDQKGNGRRRECESRPFQRHHPVGIWGQVLGRGLVPRLSTGTLQLSIRCSSIHFLPSRSFPVSTAGSLNGVAFGSGRSPAGGPSCADAGTARQVMSNDTNNGLCKDPMGGLAYLCAWVRREQEDS